MDYTVIKTIITILVLSSVDYNNHMDLVYTVCLQHTACSLLAPFLKRLLVCMCESECMRACVYMQ